MQKQTLMEKKNNVCMYILNCLVPISKEFFVSKYVQAEKKLTLTVGLCTPFSPLMFACHRKQVHDTSVIRG